MRTSNARQEQRLDAFARQKALSVASSGPAVFDASAINHPAEHDGQPSQNALPACCRYCGRHLISDLLLYRYSEDQFPIVKAKYRQ